MVGTQPKYSKGEFERRGEELFEQSIREQVSAENPRHYVAIDFETGDFEVDSDSMQATRRLVGRRPDAQIWMRRVGSKVVLRIGGGLRSEASMQTSPTARPERLTFTKPK